MPKKILPKEIFRGRLTGVKLKVAPNTKTTTNNNNKNSKTGIEDINTFWDNIQTSDTPSPKKARNNKLNEEKNISYPESIINTKSKNNNDEKKKPSRAVLAMIEKLHNDDNDTTATNDFLSPSNLSRVSTAPPSASSKDVDDDDMVLSDNDNINNSMVEDEEEEEDLFPMANNNDDNEEEEHVLKHGSSKLSTSPSISTREDEQQQQSSSNNTKNSLASSTSDMIVVDGQESIHLEENAVDFLNNTSGYSSNTPESRKSSVMDNKDKLITQQDYEEESLHFSSSPSPSSYNSRKKISVYSEEDYSKQQPSASSPPASSPPAFSPPASSPSSSRITKESTMLNNTSPSSFSQEEHNINSSLPGNDKSTSTATSSKISKHSSSGDDTVDRSHDVMKQKLSSPASLKTSVTTPSQQKSNPEDDDDSQFSDDDKEGPGFSMAHPEGEEEEEERALPSKSKDKSKSKKKKKNEAPSKKRKYVTPSPSARRVTWSTGYQVDNRAYELQPISSYHTDSPQRDDDETPNGMRRSRRAKMKPLQFWKNERLVYSKGGGERIPVVTGVLTALPTPYKKRKRDESSSTDDDERTTKTSKKRDKVTHHGSENIPTYDDTKLRKKNFIMEKDTDTALVLDAPTYEIVSKKLVAYSSKLPSTQLPITGARDKKESKIVGKAAQAFNLPPSTSKDKNVSQLPGWISGHLHLPPKGIKDAEGVGNCAQVFFIQHCQPNSLEVAYGDPEEDEFQIETAQRILLNPGDFFYIPPSNVYRIENHSKEYESKLAWTIIRPFS